MAIVQATTSDGVALWWTSEGAGEAVLLVPGRGDDTDIYPSRFSEPLVESGYRVLRYDPRDTGRSGDGHDTDVLVELAADALSVLDAAGADVAHLVGFSMGGLVLSEMIVQVPDRIRTLTFLSASSLDPEAGIGPDFFEMAGEERVEGFLAAMHDPTASDRAWVESEQAASARRAPRRPHAGWRHQELAFRSEWRPLASIADAAAPTLVVHGREDRKLPLAHARAHAETIPGATLVELDGMGHIPKPAQWDAIAALVVDHLRGS